MFQTYRASGLEVLVIRRISIYLYLSYILYIHVHILNMIKCYIVHGKHFLLQQDSIKQTRRKHLLYSFGFAIFLSIQNAVFCMQDGIAFYFLNFFKERKIVFPFVFGTLYVFSVCSMHYILCSMLLTGLIISFIFRKVLLLLLYSSCSIRWFTLDHKHFTFIYLSSLNSFHFSFNFLYLQG